MTRPTPGPGTPTPPAGPSRKVMASVAGSYGTSAAPLSGQRRADNYRRQTGRDTFTAKQWRRFVHKSHRAATHPQPMPLPQPPSLPAPKPQ